MSTTRSAVQAEIVAGDSPSDPEVTLKLTAKHSLWAIICDVVEAGSSTPDNGGVDSEEERHLLSQFVNSVRETFVEHGTYPALAEDMRYRFNAMPRYFPTVKLRGARKPRSA